MRRGGMTNGPFLWIGLRTRCGGVATRCWLGWTHAVSGCPKGSCQRRAQADCDSWAAAYATFCRGVIDVVAPLVPAVKPQAAFFEELGPAGMAALADVIGYASDKGLIVILDGKRNDIGSTATAYASGLLGPGGQSPWAADALTVSPYLGDDSLVPFVDVAQRAGCRGLCPGQDVESRWRAVSGPRGRRPAALSPCGRLCRRARPAVGRAVRLRDRRRRRRGDLSAAVGRIAGRDAARLAADPGIRQPRGHGRGRGRRFRRGGAWGDCQQFAEHHLRPRAA